VWDERGALANGDRAEWMVDASMTETDREVECMAGQGDEVTRPEQNDSYRRGACVHVTLEDGRRFSGMVVGVTRKAIRVQIARNIHLRVPYGKAEIIRWDPALSELLKLCRS
jgi:hypothetical protein